MVMVHFAVVVLCLVVFCAGCVSSQIVFLLDFGIRHIDHCQKTRGAYHQYWHIERCVEFQEQFISLRDESDLKWSGVYAHRLFHVDDD